MKIEKFLQNYKGEIVKILDDEFAIVKPLCEDGSIFKYAFINYFDCDKLCSIQWTPNFFNTWIKNMRETTYYIGENAEHKIQDNKPYIERYKRLENHREILLKFYNILM